MRFQEDVIAFCIVIGIPLLTGVGGYTAGYDEGKKAGIAMTTSQSEAYLRDQYKKELRVLESAGFVLRKRGE